MRFNNRHEILQAASDFIVNLHINVIDPTRYFGLNWDVHIVAIHYSSYPKNCIIFLDIVSRRDIDSFYCCSSYHILVSYSPIAVGIITIEVWVIVGIAAGWLTHYHAQTRGKFTSDEDAEAS